MINNWNNGRGRPPGMLGNGLPNMNGGMVPDSGFTNLPPRFRQPGSPMQPINPNGVGNDLPGMGGNPQVGGPLPPFQPSQPGSPMSGYYPGQGMSQWGSPMAGPFPGQGMPQWGANSGAPNWGPNNRPQAFPGQANPPAFSRPRGPGR